MMPPNPSHSPNFLLQTRSQLQLTFWYVIFHLFIVCFITLNVNYNIEWNDSIKKEFRASDDEDLGEVYDIANGHVLVQMGAIGKEKIQFSETEQKAMKVSFS